MMGVRKIVAWGLLAASILTWNACGKPRFFSATRIDPVSCRLVANGEFVEVRFRFHGKEPFDPNRPDLFLVDEATGEKFYLMQLQRIGQVKATENIEEKTVHSILFKNREGMLKPGARVTFVIGSHRREHLTLEK
ncbi:MAG TPA: hypothetical protein DD658_03990 [Deltaproteobacteria bacterium]|nr:MAG: hypothetical protein A2X88_00420 [Deltaproteobacteria bacterium GWC2_65_14]HBO69335.1 hypothetical protein [Deltaproteobacteria bacterium]